MTSCRVCEISRTLEVYFGGPQGHRVTASMLTVLSSNFVLYRNPNPRLSTSAAAAHKYPGHGPQNFPSLC